MVMVWPVMTLSKVIVSEGLLKLALLSAPRSASRDGDVVGAVYHVARAKSGRCRNNSHQGDERNNQRGEQANGLQKRTPQQDMR